jgi:hypothetical protein
MFALNKFQQRLVDKKKEREKKKLILSTLKPEFINLCIKQETRPYIVAYF